MSDFFMIETIAVGLSMDTFSLSMAYGMLGIDKKTIIKLSIIVGTYHFIMPILGNYLGTALLKLFSLNPSFLVGMIFLILVIELIYSLFKEEQLLEINTNTSMLLFGLAVSIDSFSVGLGLMAISKNKLFVSLIFMITSFIFTYIGLNFGKKTVDTIGKKAQMLGIVILVILAISYIIK